MLRAYLAVIHDSFRAAFASRVLYIVLALIVVILLALAPFHLRQQTDWQLRPSEHFVDPPRLARRLVEDGQSGKRVAVAHIWNMLSTDLQGRIVEVAERSAAESEDDREKSGRRNSPPNENARVYRDLAAELNSAFSRRDFHDEQAFSGKRLPAEAQALLDQGIESISDLELRRLNRLLIATALRRDIKAPGTTQLDFYFGPWRWEALSTSISHAEMANQVSGQLAFVFDKFVMSIGIFIAILVTASIIPEMLEPGSLNLLLSKPVHRWGLLLAKFVGGCAFILLCASLFFAGIWLWMGIQLDMWESAVLYSIPVYLLVFAMYYSVSVLAGICFRSPILSITFAILFWAVCFSTGFGYGRLDNRFYNTSPFEMVAAGDKVMMVDLLQTNLFWSDSASTWKSVSLRPESEEDLGFAFASFIARLDELPDLPGPAGDSATGEFLANDSGLPSGTTPGSNWVSIKKDTDWEARDLGKLPSGTRVFFAAAESQVLVLDRSGFVYRTTLPPPEDLETENPLEDEQAAPGLLNRLIPSNSTGDFTKISAYDEPFDLSGTHSADFDAKRNRIALYSRGQLVILEMDEEGAFQVARETALGQQENKSMRAFVRLRGDYLYVLLGNGRLFHVDANTLETVWSDVIENRAAVRSLAVSPDGVHVAMAFRDGKVRTYDAGRPMAGAKIPRGLSGQGDLMTVAFDQNGRLWTGDRFRTAIARDPKTLSRSESLTPRADWLTGSFRYIVRPLYRAFPKPGEFYKVVARLSASGDTRYNPEIDLTRQTQGSDDAWQPLRSGIWFMLGTLGIACLLFQRTDY